MREARLVAWRFARQKVSYTFFVFSASPRSFCLPHRPLALVLVYWHTGILASFQRHRYKSELYKLTDNDASVYYLPYLFFYTYRYLVFEICHYG